MFALSSFISFQMTMLSQRCIRSLSLSSSYSGPYSKSLSLPVRSGTVLSVPEKIQGQKSTRTRAHFISPVQKSQGFQQSSQDTATTAQRIGNLLSTQLPFSAQTARHRSTAFLPSGKHIGRCTFKETARFPCQCPMRTETNHRHDFCLPQKGLERSICAVSQMKVEECQL